MSMAEVAAPLDTDTSDADTDTADAATDARLLDAAEALFARHGIDAVSVRTITQAAAANIASVHYHFGSKFDLVRALVERRVTEVNLERAPLLDALEASGTVNAHGIAAAWVRPLARMALDPTGARRNYVPFLAVLHAGGPELRALTGDVFRPHFERLLALLARALPDVAPEVRVLRFTMAADATVRALADVDRTRAPWRKAGGDVADDELIEHLIDAVAGTLAGPPRVLGQKGVLPRDPQQPQNASASRSRSRRAFP